MVIKINYTSSDIYVSTNVSPVYVVVNYSGTSGGGGNFVPYTGATGDVDLGEYELKAGQVEFDQTPTGAIGAAVMRWNDSDGTVDLGLKGGNVTLQVGQEQVLRVVNKTGADLLESQYRAVRIRLVSEGGSQGQRLAVVLAQGDNDPDSTTTIGIVTENIDNNQEGFITTSGEVRGINTTGSLQGETWVDGDIIYLSPTIPGGITKVKPTAPQHLLQLGYVIYAHNVNGKIFVKIDNGYELSELHDVYAPSPTDGQGIFWNTANLRYQNNTVAGILGYTPVPTTRTLTINGTAYDLSADRSWTVSASATPAGSNTQLQYNNAGAFGASAGLVYNDSTGAMTLSKNQNADAFISVKNETNNTSARAYISLITNTAASKLSIFGKNADSYTAYKTLGSGDTFLFNSQSGDISFLNDFGTGKIKFAAGGSSAAQMTLTDTGLIDIPGTLLIGTSGNSIPSAALKARFVSNTTGSDVEINGNGYARLYFNDYSRGSDLKYYEMLNFNGDWKISRLNDLNTIRTERLTIFGATGNVFVGSSPSDAGYKLDVNGTARVSGNATITGNLTLSNSNPLSLTNASAYFSIGSYFFGASGSIIGANASSSDWAVRVSSGGLLIANGTNNNHLLKEGLALFTDNAANTNITGSASAVLQANSTTKGFLPPRMTTTQKNAIGTPAAGLMVFDTTLVKLCVYNGTAWETITSI